MEATRVEITFVPAILWRSIHEGTEQLLSRIQGVGVEFVVTVDEVGSRFLVWHNVTDGEVNSLRRWANQEHPGFSFPILRNQGEPKLAYWRAWDEAVQCAVRMASEDILANSI